MTTMTAYRMVKTKHKDSAFDGEGARRCGGRWNSKGKQCVYVGELESVTTVEVLVHLNDQTTLNHYALFRIEIPEEKILRIDELPDDWREDPAPASTAQIGDAWLDSNESVALLVPSAVCVRDHNLLLNPNHPDIDTIIETAEELEYWPDPRLGNGTE
jgi:RES domain-containing protein